MMLRRPYLRRSLAALLAIVGAMMMFLAPETWAGALLLALGVTIEVVGIALKHRNRQR